MTREPLLVFAGCAVFGLALLGSACGMRSPLHSLSSDDDSGVTSGDNGGAGGGNRPSGTTSAGGGIAGSTTSGRGGSGGAIAGSGGHGNGGAIAGSGGHGGGGAGAAGRGGSAGAIAASGGTMAGHGGSGLAPNGGNAAGGVAGSGGMGGARSGGTTGTGARLADASPDTDARPTTDAVPVGTPTINPNSGYVTVSTGTVQMSGFVSSYVGGSGSSISLTYTDSYFCATGTVGASSTYSSWAGAGFNVNQAQTGSSGSTSSLPLVGTTISVSYVNRGGSTLQFQLWDGSNYWCYYLPPSTTATTATFPLASLNTQCWDGRGSAFVSGTPITTVQLDVPGNATRATPYDYCFLGLTVQ